MRILHTSDWHLGRTLHGVDLHDHHAAFLDHLVDLVDAAAVDAVVVAGDVYDRAVPPVASVELLSDALARLTARTRVVLTPGNHDSATRLGFGAGLFRDRLAVRAAVAGAATPVNLPDADGGTGAYVYALPYLDPDLTRDALAEPSEDGPRRPVRSHQAVTAAALRRVHADLAGRRRDDGARVPAVLLAHTFVTGGAASESERDIRVGGVDSVPSGVFGPADALDYVALGHLHGPQRVGREGTDPVMRYAGSPLAFSFSEARHRKSTALVELGPAGVTSVELVPAPVPRRLGDVTGPLAELLGPALDAVAQDWLRVTVTDDVRPLDLWAQVTRRFPHALVVQHRPANAPARAGARTVTAGQDPLAVAADFLAAAGGRPATAAELAAVAAAYETVLATERSA
ncbi:exonuclease SbcCD subunit D C-terminal domain-containing protein [Georgenia sp. TF02-10]|uniref:exonuclease SbcCD subunit D n=1 Tax=Georgenia sp. TF02-10 TaxID=2917725 RepID=UPI001FA760FB|nr:exonuclease SbcCD subunit D C-terminal domain-containing protein [Georgenia sp. TF02-10]UNX55834.1 exonuclease SbcCD subunit D C-terminal domain-containing protein [Georgenia sp. TF02-10]